MRLLLLGGSGQVGAEICALAPQADVELAAPEHSEFDIRDSKSLSRILDAKPWDIVINASAYTDVDRAEAEESAAFAINSEAPSQIAAETGRRGIPFIQISTDYVFDGRKGTPYVEQDKVQPLNAYGRSKAAGEQGVRAATSRHIILRTAWVFSHRRKNFVKTILRLAGERDQLKVVNDQFGCPTPATDVAKACLDVANLCVADPEKVPYGTYHFTGAGEASWFEVALAIISLAGKRISKPPKVLPIPTSEYPTPATRPRDTRLDCSAVKEKFNIRLRPWKDSLKETIDRLQSEKDRT